MEIEGAFSMEPRFETREEFAIAGYRKHTREGFQVIGESWFALKSHMDAVERKNRHTMYGLEDYSEEFCSEPLAFYYMAGVEVDKNAKLPEGMYRKVVGKADYAVFTVNGNNANGEIGQAFHYIYFVWLPNSEYCMDENALLDFEYYDERWDCQFGAAQMDIYVPVKRMEE